VSGALAFKLIGVEMKISNVLVSMVLIASTIPFTSSAQSLNAAEEATKVAQQELAKAYAKAEKERLRLERIERKRKEAADKKRDSLLDDLFKDIPGGRAVNPDYTDGDPDFVPSDSNPVPIHPELIRTLANEFSLLREKNEQLEKMNDQLIESNNKQIRNKFIFRSNQFSE
jgi:hypothetical protein